MRPLVLVCFALAMSLRGAPLQAQDEAECMVDLVSTTFVDVAADVGRVLDLHGARSERSFLVRRMSDRQRHDTCVAPGALTRLAQGFAVPLLPSRGAALLPLDLRTALNTAYPRDWNDGAVWSGRGLSSTLTVGTALRWGALEAGLAPLLTLEQNTRFDLLPWPETSRSPYAHRWHGLFIDLPQRFGTGAHHALHVGQSYARVASHGFRAGVSAENLKWGPARRNPLMLSGTSAGFPHAFIETARPHGIGIGTAEVQLLWGRLSESAFFDKDPDNDRRLLAGFLAVLQPRGLDGLYLGAGHLHARRWDVGTDLTDLVTTPFTGTSPDSVGLPRDLRLFGVFMRWASAPGGIEVYGEWVRQDSWEQWVRLLNPVDAAQAYTLGLVKVVRRGDAAVQFSAEITHLSDALAHRDLGRGTTTYYVSPHVPQGHTHHGQLLGAPIGPGSEAQFIGVDVFWRAGRTGMSIERARYDDDAYYAVWGQHHGPHGHDTELSVRAGHVHVLGPVSLEAEVGWSLRYSRSLLGLHHVNYVGFPYRRDDNIGVRVGARWTPPLGAWSR